MFPFAALGAGLGQFAQDYQRQQEQARQTLMLQMQLANWQREFDKDRRDSAAAGIEAGFQLPAAGPRPIQGLPQAAAQPGGQQTQPGSLFEGQYTGYPFPMTRTNGQFPALPPNTTNNAGVLGPGFPTQASTMGSDRLAQLPPPRGGQPADPLRGLPTDTATTTDQAAALARGLAGTLASGGAQPGGAQMAQASDKPQPPVPPPPRAKVFEMAKEQFPRMDARTIRQAIPGIEKGLREEYAIRLQEYNALMEQYKEGPLHQQRRVEKIDDLRTTSQIPQREGPKLIRGPGGEMREWQPGTPLPDGGRGWTVAGTGDPEMRGRDKITLENGVVVTGIPGKPDSWTTLYGEPLTPEQHGMLRAGKVQKFGSAASQVDPAVVEGVAKGIADYKMAPVTSWAMRSPFGQAVMAKVRELNPEYDQAKYNQRARGLIAFTTGRQGDSVRSFNTSIDHLEVMDDAVQALINGDAKLLNKVENWVQQQFGYAAPVDFNFVKNIVGGEISKAVVGGVGALKDREEVRQGFELANSPEQLDGVIKRAKQLMAGQLSNYRRQSEATGFPVKDFDTMLSPATRKQLEQLYAPGTLSRQTPQGDGAGATPPATGGAGEPLPAWAKSYPDGTGFKIEGVVKIKRGDRLLVAPGAVETSPARAAQP